MHLDGNAKLAFMNRFLAAFEALWAVRQQDHRLSLKVALSLLLVAILQQLFVAISDDIVFVKYVLILCQNALFCL